MKLTKNVSARIEKTYFDIVHVPVAVSTHSCFEDLERIEMRLVDLAFEELKKDVTELGSMYFEIKSFRSQVFFKLDSERGTNIPNDLTKSILLARFFSKCLLHKIDGVRVVDALISEASILNEKGVVEKRSVIVKEADKKTLLQVVDIARKFANPHWLISTDQPLDKQKPNDILALHDWVESVKKIEGVKTPLVHVVHHYFFKLMLEYALRYEEFFSVVGELERKTLYTETEAIALPSDLSNKDETLETLKILGGRYLNLQQQKMITETLSVKVTDIVEMTKHGFKVKPSFYSQFLQSIISSISQSLMPSIKFYATFASRMDALKRLLELELICTINGANGNLSDIGFLMKPLLGDSVSVSMKLDDAIRERDILRSSISDFIDVLCKAKDGIYSFESDSREFRLNNVEMGIKNGKRTIYHAEACVTRETIPEVYSYKDVFGEKVDVKRESNSQLLKQNIMQRIFSTRFGAAGRDKSGLGSESMYGFSLVGDFSDLRNYLKRLATFYMLSYDTETGELFGIPQTELLTIFPPKYSQSDLPAIGWKTWREKDTTVFSAEAVDPLTCDIADLLFTVPSNLIELSDSAFKTFYERRMSEITTGDLIVTDSEKKFDFFSFKVERPTFAYFMSEKTTDDMDALMTIKNIVFLPPGVEKGKLEANVPIECKLDKYQKLTLQLPLYLLSESLITLLQNASEKELVFGTNKNGSHVFTIQKPEADSETTQVEVNVDIKMRGVFGTRTVYSYKEDRENKIVVDLLYDDLPASIISKTKKLFVPDGFESSFRDVSLIRELMREATHGELDIVNTSSQIPILFAALMIRSWAINSKFKVFNNFDTDVMVEELSAFAKHLEVRYKTSEVIAASLGLFCAGNLDVFVSLIDEFIEFFDTEKKVKGQTNVLKENHVENKEVLSDSKKEKENQANENENETNKTQSGAGEGKGDGDERTAFDIASELFSLCTGMDLSHSVNWLIQPPVNITKRHSGLMASLYKGVIPFFNYPTAITGVSFDDFSELFAPDVVNVLSVALTQKINSTI